METLDERITEGAYDDGLEYRYFGPPGTGKTTTLTRQIRRAVSNFGSSSVLVASFTRTAAKELAGKKLPIPEEAVATLHAHAYRAIGKPPVVETPEYIERWNKEQPAFQITGQASTDASDPYGPKRGPASAGDDALMLYQTLRARMMPRERWLPMVARFAHAWEEFKGRTGSVDFTDMIERALNEIDFAPGQPSVGFFDEAQDFVPLELALARQWASHMKYAIFAGDDDQCLYAFKGATPEAFLKPDLPPEQKKVLHQSYRVPAAVHAYATRWIERVQLREPKEYQPRHIITGLDEQDQPIYGDEIAKGAVRHLGQGNKRDCGFIIKDIEEQLGMNRTVMILATCGYILQPVKNALRENGILFHNPYNVKRGDWNPLGKGAGAESVLAYTGPAERLKDKFDLSDRASLMRLLSSLLWNHDELEAWLDVCAVSSFMPRGAKVDWLAAEPYPEDQGRFRGSNVAEYFNEESDLVSAANADLNWLAKHLKAADAKRLAYVIEVAKRHGPKKLKERPRVILGTIHSVKGGQADVVYVFPDASEAGRRAWDGPQIDEVIRQFYVAFTRAREELVLCPPATRVFIPLP